VALGDLASRLRSGGRDVDVLPAGLALRDGVAVPVQAEVVTGNALWERVSGGDAGDLPLADGASTDAPRVRVHGFLNGEMGLGEAGRAMVESLEAAGVSLATKSYSGHSNRNEHPFAERPDDGGAYPIEVFCFNAESTTGVLSKGPREEAGRYAIGLWYWELESIPSWMISGLRWLDEVWVGSDFIRDALRRVTRVPVMTVPPLVAAHEGRPTVTRADVGLPEGFLFGFTFDHNSTMARKNPIGLVEAFKRAFAPGEGPQLVIKAINAASWPENQARLMAAIGDRPDITVMERYLPSDQSRAFTGLFDCWVSLHRSEGFGLTMAEAMAWGTPVVATAYSANLDYMDESNGWLVPFAGGTVEAGVAAYAEGEWWAEPDVSAAARILREVWQNPDEAAVRGECGRETMRRRYSAGAIGAIARARLEQVAAGLAEHVAVNR
jgi:glycosyltransferase involved in cell wall biosynthesis